MTRRAERRGVRGQDPEDNLERRSRLSGIIEKVVSVISIRERRQRQNERGRNLMAKEKSRVVCHVGFGLE